MEKIGGKSKMNKELYKDCLVDMIIGESDDSWDETKLQWLNNDEKARQKVGLRQNDGYKIPMIKNDDIQLIASRLIVNGPDYVLGFARMIYYASRSLNSIIVPNTPKIRLTSKDVEIISDELVKRLQKRLEPFSVGMKITVRKFGESSFGLRYE